MPIQMKAKSLALASILILSAAVVGCTKSDVSDDGTRMQGFPNPPVNQTQGLNTNERIQVADQAANKVVSVHGVKQANVLVTQHNAYVAAMLNDRKGQLTKDIENQIAAQVKATDPSIQNVYVSTNPEFTDRVNSYVRNVQQGIPVSGFAEQFSEMVRRVFPNAR